MIKRKKANVTRWVVILTLLVATGMVLTHCGSSGGSTSGFTGSATTVKF
jgi:hypothetical protein